MNTLLRLGILGSIVLCLDLVFLQLSQSVILPVYQNIQKTQVSIRYASAAACYVLIVAGLYFFIIRENKTVLDAAILGVFVYGVYDLTVYSVFTNYTLGVAMMDMVWGGILFGLSTAIYRKVVRMLRA
jgi:uncharacterized membrane protein